MSDEFQDSKHKFGGIEDREEHEAFVVHIPTDVPETLLSENNTFTESGDMRFYWYVTTSGIKSNITGGYTRS